MAKKEKKVRANCVFFSVLQGRHMETYIYLFQGVEGREANVCLRNGMVMFPRRAVVDWTPRIPGKVVKKGKISPVQFLGGGPQRC